MLRIGVDYVIDSLMWWIVASVKVKFIERFEKSDELCFHSFVNIHPKKHNKTRIPF